MSVGGCGSSGGGCSSGASNGGGGGGNSTGGAGGHSSKGGNDGMDNISLANQTETIKQQKKVCFICGSQTTFTINIYEPRSGPNIVDVINQKFKVQPLNEDKFLCYSCNNWLINWYSVQNKSGSASGSSSNSSGGGSTATTTTTSKENKTKSKISQNQEADDAPMDSDSYFNGCGQTLELRKKLQKHLYVPKTVWPSDGFTVAKPIKKRKKIRRLRHCAQVKCNLCSIPLSLYSSAERRTFVERQRHQRTACTLRFCRMCKRALAKYYFNEQVERSNAKQIEQSAEAQSTSSSQIKLVNPYVLSRLKKLGTTVVREGGCASINNDNDLSAAASSTAKTTTAAAPAVISSITTTTSKPSSYLLRTNTFFIDRPDEIRSPACRIYAEHLNSNSRSQRNEKNEIILAFDRTVTEVFPAAAMTKDEEKGCGVGGFNDTQPYANKDIKVINDIYKRIPKSLSITLLA